jgi:peptide chain release factor 1
MEPAMMERSHLDEWKARLSALEADMARPDVAGDHKAYSARMREHTALTRRIKLAGRLFDLTDQLAGSRAMAEDPACDDELQAMAQEECERLEPARESAERDLMMALLPPDPHAGRNIIMEIRAGTGGDEAALFAGDLHRMYARYAETRGWTIRLIDVAESSVGGFKEIVFSVEGEDVFSRLQYESGVHRVQRIPETETQGRIHTSAATVAVLPEAEELDDIDLPADEIRLDLFCASGPGGQKVNKTTSAVRLTHLPTGIVAQSQDERSQHRNKDRAMQVLKARLLDRTRSEAAAREAGARKQQIGSGDRSERIRTYNFPQNRLTDHRINLTLYSLDRVMEGELDGVIRALTDHDLEARLAVCAGAPGGAT